MKYTVEITYRFQVEADFAAQAVPKLEAERERLGQQPIQTPFTGEMIALSIEETK